LLGKIAERDPLNHHAIQIESSPVFNPDGSILAFLILGDRDGDQVHQIVFWDPLTQKKLADLVIPCAALIEYSYDGKFLIMRCGDGSAQIYGVTKK
jgi:hypothetical protein